GIIMATGNKSLKAQLRQANNLGVLYAVIIGEEEVRSSTASFRDMTTAHQKTVPRNELLELLK
ncbi:MAG: His/Gly/Thr/Pro-type tRNA ligase C-terminal domain-containing protein, partial [Desulfatiglandales bacterium]